MTKLTILVRDRESGEVSHRVRDEPVKLRVCRSCGRAHAASGITCSAAA